MKEVKLLFSNYLTFLIKSGSGKTTKFLVLIFISLLSVDYVNSQIKVINSGKVGIGPYSTYGTDNPQHILDVKGDARIRANDYEYIKLGTEDSYLNIQAFNYYGLQGTLFPCTYSHWNLGESSNRFAYIYLQYQPNVSSDSRLKENIRDIESPLENLLKIKGLKYDYIQPQLKDITPDDKKHAKLIEKGKNKYGFIAQDLQKIYPHVVSSDEKTDTYGIEYGSMIPILVEALKEQQSQINTLIEIITQNQFKSANKATNIEQNTSEILGAVLFQNSPNPFSENTAINYQLPESIHDAMIGIYNLQGTMIKSYNLALPGEGQITITASEFKPGIYIYNLIANNIEIDSKQMIITE